MTLKVGTLSLPVGQTGCRPSIRAVRDRRGQAYMKECRIDVEGMLFGSDSQAIKAAADELVAALHNGRNDIALYDASGRRTGVFLPASSAVGGFFTCENVNYDKVDGSQWELLLDFKFTCSAMYSLDGAPPGTLIDFQEKIVRTGNSGPRDTEQEVLIGPTVRVQLVEQTRCFTVQTGFAVGFRGVPPIPRPLWPRYLINPDQTDAETGGAGYGSQEHRVEWQYNYVSPRRLRGGPTQWI